MNIFKKSLLVLGVVSLGSAVAAPAFAGSVQAYASGSSAIVLMNGASQSVGAEIAAPASSAFANSNVVVTPAVTNDLSTNTPLFDTLTVEPGLVTASPASSSFTAAAAAKLTAAISLEGIVSIIRAGAGVDGLE